MSKLTKLINQPELFILDAIKKRKTLINYELDKVNKIFNKIGIKKSLNLEDIEENIVQVSLFSYQKINLREHLLWGVELQRGIQNQGAIRGVVSQIKKIDLDFKSIYRMDLDKSPSSETYVSPQVADILKVLKDKR